MLTTHPHPSQQDSALSWSRDWTVTGLSDLRNPATLNLHRSSIWAWKQVNEVPRRLAVWLPKGLPSRQVTGPVCRVMRWPGQSSHCGIPTPNTHARMHARTHARTHTIGLTKLTSQEYPINISLKGVASVRRTLTTYRLAAGYLLLSRCLLPERW